MRISNNQINFVYKKPLAQLEHIMLLLGSRIIPCYFHNVNPKLYVQWQYNACIQTAFISTHFMKILLETNSSDNPFFGRDFDYAVYEGIFKQFPYPAPYNHAYTCIKEKTPNPGGYMFLMDLARVSNPYIFMTGTSDIIQENPAYYSGGRYQLQQKTRLNWEFNLEQHKEYYTQKLGIDVCADIEQLLLDQNFNIRKFDWNLV